jgi:hypothetical protein
MYVKQEDSVCTEFIILRIVAMVMNHGVTEKGEISSTAQRVFVKEGSAVCNIPHYFFSTGIHTTAYKTHY